MPGQGNQPTPQPSPVPPGAQPVTVLGLAMDTDLQARILAALRGLYGPQTQGMSDALAVQTVLTQWITDVLALWEASQVGPDPATAAQQASDAAATVRGKAIDKARGDAAGRMKPTATS